MTPHILKADSTAVSFSPLAPPGTHRTGDRVCLKACQKWYDIRYLFTALGSTPGGSGTVHIYTQTVDRTTQFPNWEECGPCPVFANYTLAFARV
jgi:hypothetical protein